MHKMSANNFKIELKWKRPKSVDYPKVWHTFMARDLDCDDLVEYRIEDVTESNAKDVLEHLKANFIPDAPLSQAMDCANDEQFYEDNKIVWDAAINQKTPLVCYKAGSDEIVGVNMTFVESKADDYAKQLFDSFRSDRKIKSNQAFEMMGTFCPFQHYEVDKILAEYGLSVNRKYRGRKVGTQLLATHKLLCKAYGLKLSHVLFTSDYADACANNVGFVTNVTADYESFAKNHSEYSWMRNVKSKRLTKKSLLV